MSDWVRDTPIPGDLIHQAGKWITVAPTHCPNGHRLGPTQVVVSRVVCDGHGGGHLTWSCEQCRQMVYGPPLGDRCHLTNGPGQYGG